MSRAKQSASGIAALAPMLSGREHKKHRAAVMHGPLRHVITAAMTERSTADLLLEIYLAGLWHGAEIGRKHGAIYGEEPEAPRKRDVITV